MRVLGTLAVVVCLGACIPQDFDAVPTDPTTDPPTNAPPPVTSDVPRVGTTSVALTADGGAANDVVVSFGLPFPQGVVGADGFVTLKNAAGQAVPITTKVLATWPNDASIRSVLVMFKASLAAGATEKWTAAWGTPSESARAPAGELEPNPDGPISATLSGDFYAKSHVSGILLPASANQRFPTYEPEMENGLRYFDFNAYGIDCTASAGRTYYDGPHAQYQRFLRSGDPKHLRAARTESHFFRDSELTFYAGGTVAVQKCELPAWTPSRAMDWGTLRMMLSQGMLDDYLVTGDPAAHDAVVAMGEAYRLNLPALSTPDEPILEITERNLGWPLMGLASYYALDHRNEVRDAMRSLVTRVIAWQARGDSGALEHDLVRPDPDECGEGPSGASPFMTSLVVDGLMDYWLLTSDTASLAPFTKKLATWYEQKALTTDKKAFRYLWNCETEPYDDSSTADLNLLIVHVFGAAYVLTRDLHWITFGDAVADSGISEIFVKHPKQWNQSGRAFGKYLGYRALGVKP